MGHGQTVLKISFSIENVVVLASNSHTSFAILAHPFLEEVTLALKADESHPGEGVFSMVEARLVECNKKTVGAEFDVGLHEVGVHANQTDGEGIADKFLFNLDSILNDTTNGNGSCLVY